MSGIGREPLKTTKGTAITPWWFDSQLQRIALLHAKLQKLNESSV